MKSERSVAVLYHKTCLDGSTAGWVAWKKFGKKADYFPVEPREIPDAVYQYKTVYALDTSINESDLKKFHKKGIKTVVIDHHVSSKENVERADEFRFSCDHSGATLSWDYFFPRKKVPKFVAHIEDLDLWKFKLPYTRELDAYCELVPYEDFSALSKLIQKFENKKTREEIIKKGKIILEHQNHLVGRLVENAEYVQFEKIKTYAVNSPVFNSFIGDSLWKKLPPIAIIWYEKEGKRFVSLRSNGVVDVTLLAKKYGGGGHKVAAGFRISANKPLPWKRILQKSKVKTQTSKLNFKSYQTF